MRIRISDFCITLIYIFVFISAITMLRFTLTLGPLWRVMYHFSIDSIIFLCIIYLVNKRRVFFDSLIITLVLMVLFELTTSYVNSLFVVPMIFVDVITWPLLLIVFYYYSLRNEIPKYFKEITLIGITIICIFSIPNLLSRGTIDNFGGAVFASYYCFAFLPMVYFTCTGKISAFYNIIVFFLMLFSLKRAALLIVFLGIGVYYIFLNYCQGKNLKNLRNYFLMFLSFLIFSILAYFIIVRFNLSILSRLESMSEDGGSGRLVIWNSIIQNFIYSSQEEKWFGHGFHAVFYNLQPFGVRRFAHNSFIETLYDYGYVGVGFIILFVKRIVSETIRMIKLKYSRAPIMAFTIIPLFILSLVSYFFEQAIIILPFSVIWGICLGSFKRENKGVIAKRPL